MPKVTVDKNKCTGCETCVNTCPVGVFVMKEVDGKKVSVPENMDKCIACHACEGACPVEGTIKVEE